MNYSSKKSYRNVKSKKNVFTVLVNSSLKICTCTECTRSTHCNTCQKRIIYDRGTEAGWVLDSDNDPGPLDVSLVR